MTVHAPLKALFTTTGLPSLLAAFTLLLMTVFSTTVSGAIEHRTFKSEEQRTLYHELIRELRCLVCQNQNLAESDADLAKDLRNKTFELINDGKDRSAIVDFMVQRYGDFVMYRPPFNLNTALLWLGPLVLLLGGLLLLVRIARKGPEPTASATVQMPAGGVDIATARRLLDSLKDDDAASLPDRASRNGADNR